MGRCICVVLLVTVLGGMVPAPARAELCTIDAVPAATLLLPYFEIELGRKGKAEETLITIRNAGPAPAIAHVVLWTDLSVPTINFDVYLTGYDVQTISLKDLFFDFEFPETLNGDGDPECSSIGGLQTLADLRAAHTGGAVDGVCYGTPSGRTARGYITIDNAVQCSTLFPSDGGYFGSDGVASDNNALTGEYSVFRSQFIQSDRLVHIEAGNFTSGRYTFYGRYVGFNGSDNREPLGTTWSARYIASSQFKSYLTVWRDSGVEQPPFACDLLGTDGWFPLPYERITAFNEVEDFQEVMDEVLTAETQRVRVDGGPGFPAGWLLLDLEHPETVLQSYVTVRLDFKKRRSQFPADLTFPEYGIEGGDNHACGPAPEVPHGPIPFP